MSFPPGGPPPLKATRVELQGGMARHPMKQGITAAQTAKYQNDRSALGGMFSRSLQREPHTCAGWLSPDGAAPAVRSANCAPRLANWDLSTLGLAALRSSRWARIWAASSRASRLRTSCARTHAPCTGEGNQGCSDVENDRSKRSYAA